MLIDIARLYFKENFMENVHPFYQESVADAESLQVHSRGLMPTKMLKISRPNEKPEYVAYREQAYKPVTKTYYHKAVSAFGKAHQAEDWKIEYPDKKPMVSSLSLQDYMENSYPEFDSFENFFFSYGQTIYGDDANAVFAVFPLNVGAPDNELPAPFTFVFESAQVLDFVDRKYCVLLDEQKSLVGIGDKLIEEGNIFHLLDETQYIKAVQIGEQKNYSFEVTILNHNGGYLPAMKIGRKIKLRKGGRTLYESDLSPALPFWDEVISDFSDHQVNKKLHLFPYMWEIGDTQCKTCKGDGRIKTHNPANKLHPYSETTCNACDGHGYISIQSPFGVKRIKPEMRSGPSGGTAIPTPPMGYVDRPIESIGFMRDEWKENLRLGLSALNMEHLFEEPVVNSGVAKTVDKQEYKSLMLSVYRHFVENLFNPIYEFHNNWRYGFQPERVRYANLPTINTPQKIDLLTIGLLSDRLKQAREGNYSPEIIAGLELQLSKLEFGKESMIVRKLELKHRLDPLPYLSPEQKNESIINSSSPATSYENYVISSNIDNFISRAIEENPKFYELDYKAQVDKLKTYAGEIRQASRPLASAASLSDMQVVPEQPVTPPVNATTSAA